MTLVTGLVDAFSYLVHRSLAQIRARTRGRAIFLSADRNDPVAPTLLATPGSAEQSAAP